MLLNSEHSDKINQLWLFRLAFSLGGRLMPEEKTMSFEKPILVAHGGAGFITDQRAGQKVSH